MTPEHVFDEEQFAEALARTPPPDDSRACWGWPPGDSTEPRGPVEERKPAGLWDILCWLFGGG